MIYMQLIGGFGEPLGSLEIGADEIIAEAERHARDNNMSKRRCFPLVLRRHVEAGGCEISESDLNDAVAKLDCVRSGERLSEIQLRVRLDESSRFGTKQVQEISTQMSHASRFFETDASTDSDARRGITD